MKHYQNGYVSNRVLKLNVGFLLAAGPGHSHKTTFDVPPVRVADDVDLSHIHGTLRLSRTKEGILVQGRLTVGMETDCYRCLTAVDHDVDIHIEELFNHPAQNDVEFSIGDDAILNLAPLLRAESLIEAEQRVLCRPDCQGICPTCGANRNETTCDCAPDEIDPRLAKLKELLDAKK